MTFKYKKVYIDEVATVSGLYEKKGPIGKYFDKSYNDLYFGEKSFELAEQKSVYDCINILLDKAHYKEVDLVIGGDLSNQLTATTFGSKNINASYMGVYTACATSVEQLIIAANFIEGKKISNGLCVTSSHNMTSEKQFRNPTEYGAPKPKTATFTATGAAAMLLTNKKAKIKVESATIGRIMDYNQTDPNNMGAVMAPGAAYVINKHLTDLNRKVNYYDLILTGDLGLYGKEILKELLLKKYDIKLGDNYNDCGVMLYDLDKQEECLAGGSGPVCSALVMYAYIIKKMQKKEIKRVLFVPTGALFSPTSVFQGQNILSIAHAISLEVI